MRILINHKKIIFLVNPLAGNGSGKKSYDEIKTQLTKHAINSDVYISKKSGDIKSFICSEDLEKYDGICTIGGDGTIHEAIEGLMHSKKTTLPLAVFPGGSGNSFCNDLSIIDMSSALKALINFKISPIDVMEINNNNKITYSANIIGWGIASKVNLLAEKLRFLGSIRYSIASILCILRLKSKMMDFLIGDKKINGQGLLFLALNTMHTGKGMKMAPKASLNDGLIDIIYFKKASKLRIFKIFTQVFSGRHINDPLVEYHQTDKFEINTINDHLNIDGENIGQTPIKVSILPSKLYIFADIR